MIDLSRFHQAQKQDYDLALKEIRSGRKYSHYIWYIFPQLKDLGYSPTAKYYGIADLKEAKAYLNDELLKARLLEISEALLAHRGQKAESILGSVDAMKVRSSMTLFYCADSRVSVFKEVIDAFYDGQMDQKTLDLLEVKNEGNF